MSIVWSSFMAFLRRAMVKLPFGPCIADPCGHRIDSHPTRVFWYSYDVVAVVRSCAVRSTVTVPPVKTIPRAVVCERAQ